MPEEELHLHPKQSPYFHALSSARYDRQDLIRSYEDHTERRLIVYIGVITNSDIAPFVDLLDDIEPSDQLDLLLASPGGDGETALRLAKLCHKDRTDFRVIVPDEAKSAATLLALGADEIVMSASSDLGPVDPQIYIPARGRLMPAKRIVEIVDDLESRLQKHPEARSLYGALLADIDAVVWQQARASIDHIPKLVEAVLKCRIDPPDKETTDRIKKELITDPVVHEAVIDIDKAKDIGLPATYLPPATDDWRFIWRLYAKYVALIAAADHPVTVIESRQVSLWR